MKTTFIQFKLSYLFHKWFSLNPQIIYNIHRIIKQHKLCKSKKCKAESTLNENPSEVNDGVGCPSGESGMQTDEGDVKQLYDVIKTGIAPRRYF